MAKGMKALSMDLRERIAKAKGKGSGREIGERFEVPDSSVRRIWLLFARTGSLEPRRRGGNRARKVDPEGEAMIRSWIVEQSDLTIVEVMARYQVERGIAV